MAGVLATNDAIGSNIRPALKIVSNYDSHKRKRRGIYFTWNKIFIPVLRMYLLICVMIDLHYEVSVMTHCQFLTSSVKPKPGVKLGQNVEILAGVSTESSDFLKG